MVSSRRYRQSRGIALITAMWFLAVLLVLVAGFAAMVHSDAEIARNFGELTRARWAAQAGYSRALVEIQQRGALPATSLDGGAQLTLDSQDEEVALGNATYQTVIEDEAGKININTATSDMLQMLFSVEVVDAIIDWRDSDSTPQPQGAEDDLYTGLDAPYHCKNAPFDTVDELLLVNGVTAELLDTPVTDGGVNVRDLLTVSSVDSNTDASGQARVNIKTATQEQLSTAVGDVFSDEELEAIITQRTSTPFDSPADLLNVPNMSREKVALVFDRLTASTVRERPGLININTAPVEVLAALPGMDEALAQAIVQQRTEQGAFETVGQLLDIEQISNSLFIRIADLLTTRSRTFRIVSTGQMKDGSAQAITCVLRADTTSGGMAPQILFWRE